MTIGRGEIFVQHTTASDSQSGRARFLQLPIEVVHGSLCDQPLHCRAGGRSRLVAVCCIKAAEQLLSNVKQSSKWLAAERTRATGAAVQASGRESLRSVLSGYSVADGQTQLQAVSN